MACNYYIKSEWCNWR